MAEYHGREVELNKILPGDVKKFKVFVRDPKTGNIKKVNFGAHGYTIKRGDPEHRKAYRERHHCDDPNVKKPITSAEYWSCKNWERPKKGDKMTKDFDRNSALEHTPEEKLPWREEDRKRMHAALDRMLDARRTPQKMDSDSIFRSTLETLINSGFKIVEHTPQGLVLVSPKGQKTTLKYNNSTKDGAWGAAKSLGRKAASFVNRHAADKK